MLTLDINKYRQKALDFQKKYTQNLLKAINEKQNELGSLQAILTSEFLEKLLMYSPKKQCKLIAITLKKFDFLNDKSSQEMQALKYIFVQKGYEQIDKKEFYDDLGINSCVYCNRNYIFNLYTNGHIKGQIDHFYDKSKYPFLAMSFYNLIPSCEGCNRVKGIYDTYEHNSISPYNRKKNILFSTKINSVDDFEYTLNKDDLLEKLLIEKIYNQGHKDILNDMYQKFYQEETKEHFDMLRKEFKQLTISDEEVHRYLTGGYFHKDEFHKRTFSKLIKDISEELELL